MLKCECHGSTGFQPDCLARSPEDVHAYWPVRHDTRAAGVFYGDAMTKTKKCTKCGEVKDMEAFPRNATRTIGRVSQCKDCTYEANRKRYRKNRSRYRARQRAYYVANHDKARERQRKFYAAHPEVHRAKGAVQTAIAGGDLVRGQCEVHGATCDGGRIEAHHDDYDKLLDVRWLCRLSHIRLHGARRRTG